MIREIQLKRTKLKNPLLIILESIAKASAYWLWPFIRDWRGVLYLDLNHGDCSRRVHFVGGLKILEGIAPRTTFGYSDGALKKNGNSVTTGIHEVNATHKETKSLSQVSSSVNWKTMSKICIFHFHCRSANSGVSTQSHDFVFDINIVSICSKRSSQKTLPKTL